MSCPRVSQVSVPLLSLFVIGLCASSWAQASHAEQVQVRPPLMRSVDPPAKDATESDLEAQADELHMQKLFLDAIDYYRAALSKSPKNARVLNKICRTQLVMSRWHDAQKTCEQAVKADHGFAGAYSNLGVALYEQKRYGPAVKEYRRAIGLDATSAIYFVNLGAALFSKKEFEPAVQAYQRALELDPDSFYTSSRGGVQAQLPGPEDRAHYDYTVAKLYAKMGLSDRSLAYLKKAREEGYKDFKNVYKDAEFSELRKDPRFAELVAAKTPSLD